MAFTASSDKLSHFRPILAAPPGVSHDCGRGVIRDYVNRRQHVRHILPSECQLQVQWETPEGEIATAPTRPLNISAKGLGFLCSLPIAVGSPCTCFVLAQGGHSATLSGTVAACRPAGREIHHVGVSLDEEIDIWPFLDPLARGGGAAASTDGANHDEMWRRIDQLQRQIHQLGPALRRAGTS